MDSKSGVNIANLRFIQWRNQVNLSFRLQYKCERFGEIDEEILTVRQFTETVDALIKHTENKVQRIFQDRMPCGDDKENVLDKWVKDTSPSIELCATLKRKNKSVQGGTTLKQLETFKDLTFSILNIRYKVIVNSPFIESIKLPDVIYCDNPTQPLQLKAILSTHELNEYGWYKSADKIEWTKVGTNFCYHVTEKDVNNYLKFICIPKNNFQVGEPFEVISNDVVLTTPNIPSCPFEDRQKATNGFLSGNMFRVISYNTLSSLYTSTQFPYCPNTFLSVDYRKKLLVKEITGYNADVICLQEVDNKIYSFYFREEFKKFGYGSIFNKKGNRLPEGLATFYNKNRFSFAGQGQIVFSTEIRSNQSLRGVLRIIESDLAVSEVFKKQATSMQYCKVKSKNSNDLLIIANTHLYYHPDANNVRLLQTAVCLEYLKHLYNREVKNNKHMKVSMIFCGDFNSQPDSAVYKFVTNGVAPYKSEDVASSYPTTTLFQSFQFNSACGTPKYTNYTEDFRACLDYVFHDSNIDTVTYVPFPSEEVLSENVALPSNVFPSDHIALVADLKFK